MAVLSDWKSGNDKNIPFTELFGILLAKSSKERTLAPLRELKLKCSSWSLLKPPYLIRNFIFLKGYFVAKDLEEQDVYVRRTHLHMFPAFITLTARNGNNGGMRP